MTVRNSGRESDENAPNALAPWIPAGSRCGRLIAEKDWSQSELGPIEAWPSTLTQLAQTCLESSFPFAIAWGPNRLQLYNDAFATLCGGKHPSALGQDMRRCWESAWAVLGPCFERATNGDSAYVEDGRLFLDRAGFLEEAFATFSFSPLREANQTAVSGVLLTVIETTSKVLGERRTRLLRDIVDAGAGVTNAPEAFAVSMAVLDTAPRDVPFALLYRVDARRDEAELVARTRWAPQNAAPPSIPLKDAIALASSWPLADVVVTNRPRISSDLPSRFGDFDCAPYPEAPVSALLLPIGPPGASAPSAVLVAAQSPRLQLNGEYVVFFERMAAAVASNLAAAHAHEAQRLRAEHAERATEQLEAFSYSVSHDLRAPLRAINGFSQALLERKSAQLDEEAKQLLGRVRGAAERMAELIDDLLNLARVSGAPLHREPISLTSLAERVAANLTEAEPGRELAFRADAGLTAHADQRLLLIVLQNLLENSWKFTRRRHDAEVHVGSVHGAETPTYFVRDNGAGFDQSFAQRLFQPFQRLHLERDYPGTGIGLAIVHRIITRHGGRVWATGQEERGATFYFTLPQDE